jgi:iron complex outermembrane receptor protein
LSWRAGEATSVGFEYEYIDQNLLAHRLRGVPVNAAGTWLAAREWTASEPTDRSELQARVFQTRVDHAFTSTFRTDVSLRFLNYEPVPERYHEPRGHQRRRADDAAGVPRPVPGQPGRGLDGELL